MIRLPIIAAGEATGKAKEIYSDVASIEGEPHLLLQCFANDPGILRVEWELEKELMHGRSVLSAKLRKYIGLTVAMLSGCGG